jgi:hypothetical protein
MQPILNKTSGREGVKAHGQRGAAVLILLLGLAAAQADTTGFTGAFGTNFWSLTPGGHGSVYFTNADTELVLAGPETPPPGGTSLDGILYNHPLGGGLAVGGTVSFHWVYNSGDADPVQADVRWDDVTPPPFAQGPAVNQPGDFLSPLIIPGTTNLMFLLTTTPAAPGKLSSTLIITDFQFHDVPEPSTGALLASVLISLGAARRWRCRRKASGQR